MLNLILLIVLISKLPSATLSSKTEVGTSALDLTLLYQKPNYAAVQSLKHLQLDRWPSSAEDNDPDFVNKWGMPDDTGANKFLYTVSTRSPNATRTVMVVCGIHGRELITRRLCTEWLQTMIDNPDHQSLLRIVLMVEMNPEGLTIAEQPETQCWRGNARGVDLNRNWPTLTWYQDEQRSDLNPSSEVYAGTGPLSEWESRALLSATDHFVPNVLLAVHSGTEALLLPYDASDAVMPPNYQQLVNFAHWLRLGVCTEQECLIARAAQLMYSAVGTLTDYHYWWGNADLVVTLEVYGDREAADQLALDQPNPQWLTDKAQCRNLFNPRSNVEVQRVLSRWQPAFDRLLFIDRDDHQQLVLMTPSGEK